MDFLVILAQAGENAQQASQPESGIVPVQQIWSQITGLGSLEALTFISFGMVCLLYGWRVFKILVVISFALFGLWAGMFISSKIGEAGGPVISVLLGIVFAIASIPLMKYAVSILGAISGGLITAGVWHAAALPETYIWAGALVGIVAGGMISFIVFRMSVILFSSLAGSALIITGIMALLHIYQPTSQGLENLYFNQQWFLPTVLIIPALLGLYMQHKLVKGSQDWTV